MTSRSTTQLRTLFVRGIARAFDDDAFRQLLDGQKGVIKSFLIRNRQSDSGGHKGIGFIEFDSTKNAKAALDALNGRRVGDRELKVEFAKEREAFGERKKRKWTSAVIEQRPSVIGEGEEDPFAVLGVHAKVRSVAVGGLSSDLLRHVKERVNAMGKVEGVIFPAPSSICTAAHLFRDGCPKEVAIFTFHNVAAALKAVVQLHDVTLKTENGEELRLWCRQVSGEGAYIKRNKVIIRNLPFQMDSKKLHELLSVSGYVWKLDVPTKKGFAFAYFTTRAHAQNAIANANGQTICGRTIAVDWAVSKKRYQHQEEVIDSDADERIENVLKSMVINNTDEHSMASESNASSNRSHVEDEEHGQSGALAGQSDVTPSETNFIDGEKREESLEKEAAPHVPSHWTGLPKEEEMDTKKKQGDLSRTIFVSGLALDVEEHTLKSYMEQFGPLKSVFVVKNKATGKSKGTAFVEYVNEQDQKRALETLDYSKKDKAKKRPSVFGLSFAVKQAMSRQDIKTIVTKRKQEKQKADRRNLYLLQEGRIEEGSEAWNELSRTDQAIRKRSIQLKRAKLKNPLFFVSKTRLCIRNLPNTMTEAGLEHLVIESIRKRASISQPVIKQAKLLYDDSSKGKSLRRGFVELDLHEHAMCALRYMNANPDVFGPQRRPIVEFAIDNRKITDRREEQIQKLKQKALEEGRVITDVTFGFGKKKRKGKNERRREKLEGTRVNTPVDRPKQKKQRLASHNATPTDPSDKDASLAIEKNKKHRMKIGSRSKQGTKGHRGGASSVQYEKTSRRIQKETHDRLDALMHVHQSQSSSHVQPKYGQWFS